MKQVRMEYGDTEILVLEQNVAIMQARGWTVTGQTPEIEIDQLNPQEDEDGNA